MRYAIYTLGCKVNQYETQALETELLRRGHTLVPFGDEADAYIINTCTVTAVSDRKSRNAIRRAKKRNPAAVVAVCGCYAQTAPEDVAALGVDLVSGTGDRLGFLNEVERLSGLVRAEAELAPEMLVDNIMTHRSFEQLPAGGLEGRTRAMLKVEDGCVNFCTYCIIPYARRSWPGTATGRLSSPASRSPPGATSSGTAPVSSTWWRASAGRRRSCGCGWAAWSPAPSPRISAAGPPPCPTCAPTSTCPCRAAATGF